MSYVTLSTDSKAHTERLLVTHSLKAASMREILFLHGFFQTDPEATPLLRALRHHLPGTTIHAPAYHPNGDVKRTRINDALELCHSIIRHSSYGKISLIGFSFGGLLASIFTEHHP